MKAISGFQRVQACRVTTTSERVFPMNESGLLQDVTTLDLTARGRWMAARMTDDDLSHCYRPAGLQTCLVVSTEKRAHPRIMCAQQGGDLLEIKSTNSVSMTHT